MTGRAAEPPHARAHAEFAAAEHAEGWMARCVDAGRYLALTREFADALAAAVLAELHLLGAPGCGPVLEVCAGDGALAAALVRRSVPVVATDAAPPARRAGPVERRTAAEALARYRPRVVLGSFVPADAGVDDLVLGDLGVRAYVVLNARLWGTCGSAGLWERSGWTAEPLVRVSRWMLTRHDAWLGGDAPPIRRGEAWRFVPGRRDATWPNASRPSTP